MLAPTLLTQGPFVAVDIETTGCRPGTSSIIEIGAARIERGRIVDTLSALVRPTEPIPAVVERLTGITDQMVASAPTIGEVIGVFAAFAHGAVLLAHSHRFDLGFLDYETELVTGTPFQRPILDTLCLARVLHPEIERNNLRDLAAFYGVEQIPNHRALPDAVATAQVFLAMAPELAARGISTAGQTARLCGVAEASDLSGKLPLATNIPDEPGVYLFRDAAGTVVYVGRARNLRTKIRTHFYAAVADDGSPAAVTEAVQHIECSSLLDAQLLEAHLRYRYRPEFNRNTSTPRAPVYLHVDTDSAFPTMMVTRRRLRSGRLLGPLTSQWAATTTADALSRMYGLRRCRRTPSECRALRCARRERGTCPAEDAYSRGSAEYALSVVRALSAFDGEADATREQMQSLRDRLARGQEFEQAAYFRDALRAYDRTLAGIAVADRARVAPVSVVVEGNPDAATLSVLINGWRYTAIRLTRQTARVDTLESRIRATLARALRRSQANPPLTPRRLEELAIIDAYIQQHSPHVIPIDGELDGATASVMQAVRRLFRIPRRRHAAASDA